MILAEQFVVEISQIISSMPIKNANSISPGFANVGDQIESQIFIFDMFYSKHAKFCKNSGQYTKFAH